MGYQKYYDKDGRYAGYSSDGDGFDALTNGSWWSILVIAAAFVTIIIVPIGLIGGIDAALGFLLWFGAFCGFSGGIVALIVWGLGEISESISRRSRNINDKNK